MKILITGANGQLGRELLLQCRAYPVNPVATDIDEMDICDGMQVERFFDREKPDLVVNAAAYTQVDAAEAEQETVFRINSEGPLTLARVCAGKNIPMLHISTDYVFDGRKGRPYIESDPVSPLGVYGKSKAEGENNVRSNLPKHIILRTSWLYGFHGHNFVKTMLRLARENRALKVVNDQFGSPTSAADLAQTILRLATHGQKSFTVNRGTYHYCGRGIVTWFQFAEKIFELAEPYNWFKRPSLEPVSTDRYVTAAERPLYSVLDCSLIQKTFDIHPEPWQKSLASIIQRIRQHETNSKS